MEPVTAVRSEYLPKLYQLVPNPRGVREQCANFVSPKPAKLVPDRPKVCPSENYCFEMLADDSGLLGLIGRRP